MQNNLRIAHALNKMTIPPITSPFKIRILWLQYLIRPSFSDTVQTGIHRHSFFEMHFPLVGSATYRLGDGTRLSIRAGSYLLLRPNMPHAVEAMSEDYHKFSFAFSIEDAEENTDAKELLHTFSSEPYFVAKQTAMCSRIFEDTLQEVENSTPLTPYRIRDFAFGLINELLRALPPPSSPLFSSDEALDPRVERACRFIRDNLHLPVTVSAIAASVHLCPKQLCRLVENAMGKSLGIIIKEEKLRRAKEYLSETTLSLQEIGHALGYSNEYNFNRFFRAAEGVTPGTYRRQMHK